MKKLLITASLTLCTAFTAHADTWPSKPVTLLVPFPPGGSTDMIARTVGAKLQEKLGSTFIVDNKAGAGGTVGAAQAKRAAPDGYTIFVSSLGPFVIGPHLIKSAGYDPLKDFDYVTVAVQAPNVLAVPANSPHKTFADLLSADPRVTAHVDKVAISRLLDPVAYPPARASGATAVSNPTDYDLVNACEMWLADSAMGDDRVVHLLGAAVLRHQVRQAGQGQRDRMLAGRKAGRPQQLDDAGANEPALALIAEALDGGAEAERVAAVSQGGLARPEADSVAGVAHLLAALDRLGEGEGGGHTECRQLRRRHLASTGHVSGPQCCALERVVTVVDRDRDQRRAPNPDGRTDPERGRLVSGPGAGDQVEDTASGGIWVCGHGMVLLSARTIAYWAKRPCSTRWYGTVRREMTLAVLEMRAGSLVRPLPPQETKCLTSV